MSKNRVDSNPSIKTLCLTEDEAMSLLEACLNTRCLDNPVRIQVLAKLGDVCRDFMRKGQRSFRETSVETTISPASPKSNLFRDRKSNRRWVRSCAWHNSLTASK